MRLKKIYHPDWFQGSPDKRNYFEGWYFKQVSSNLDHVISVIPGISLNENDPHAFIQYINGISGETHYFTFPVESFLWEKNSFDIKIGDNAFSSEKIILNLKNDSIQIQGELNFKHQIRYPGGIMNPGIMGWYSFVPTMECNHGVVSISHETNGILRINEATIDFAHGKGYIEKDWGTSFPETWIWLQCNNFSDPGTSLMFSVAKIPWRKHFFMGFISFIYYKNELIRFATYNKSKILDVSQMNNQLSIRMQNRQYILEIRATSLQGGILKAPTQGHMDRHIKESIDAEVFISLKDHQDNLLYTDHGKRAGLEIMESIFAFLNPE